MVTWKFYTWEQLTPDVLYACIKLRQSVFIVEQNCVYHDMDGKDVHAVHVVGTDNETGECIAYARLFRAGKYFTHASIGRVCSALPWRKKGVGKELMKQSIGYMDEFFGNVTIEISAQSYLLDFYAGYGFKPEGEEYLEDDIPHRRMYRHPRP